MTHGACGEVVPAIAASHNCPKASEPEPDRFEGLLRREDIQICPVRNIKTEVAEACNSMQCLKCYTSFCFLCGIKAHHNSNQWQEGNNQPGAANAKHDLDVAEVRRELVQQGNQHLAAAVTAVDD